MVNKKRLIDANDLWQKTFICDEVAEVRKFIEQAPTIDAVPVVLCKDCKHFNNYFIRCDHPKGLPQIGSNSFCSYGERREGE